MEEKKQLSQEDFFRHFVEYEHDLKCYARSLLPNREAVAEVIQEASLVMWRKLDQLQDESEFLPWAKVIVRFEVLKARQTTARDRLTFGDDVFEKLAEEAAAPIADDVLAKERKALDRCLAKLDSAQRNLVLLPYHGHGSVDKLARELGRSANSLYKKIGRLRQKLTLCVEAELEGGLS